MAAMALCYEATSMGLGTCLIGTMNQAKLHQSFGIPEERPVRLIVTVGYPAKGDRSPAQGTQGAGRHPQLQPLVSPGAPPRRRTATAPAGQGPAGVSEKRRAIPDRPGAAGRPWDQPGAGLGSGAPGSASALPLSALHPMRRTGPLPLAQPLQP